jgi:hypothetical protein
LLSSQIVETTTNRAFTDEPGRPDVDEPGRPDLDEPGRLDVDEPGRPDVPGLVWALAKV